MNFSEDIEVLKAGSAKIAAIYSRKAIYGNAKKSMLFQLLSLNAIIRSLERNVPQYKTVKVVNSLEGSYVPLSSLVSQNNVLILETQSPTTDCVLIESCLSDEEICKIIEAGLLICNQFNC